MSGAASTAEEPSDEELVAQLAAGDREKIVPLLVRYAPRILGLATAAVDHAAAEEIVQDVFVAVWRGAGSFDPGRGNFRSWLLTISRNRIANEFRRRGSRPDQQTAMEDTDFTSLADRGTSADDNVWHDFRCQTLRAAVDSLPLKQRQAVSLAFFNELTHEQVAATLDVPLGTAKSRIRSAIESLRGQLTPLRASLLIGLFLMASLMWEYRQSQLIEQDRRALWLVTTSDVVPIRLGALTGINPKTHATYRGRARETLAVMTFSNFPPPLAGQEYRAWARHGNEWTDLGSVSLDSAGNGRLIAEAPSLVKLPDGLRVTLQQSGRQSRQEPTGKPIVGWPAER